MQWMYMFLGQTVDNEGQPTQQQMQKGRFRSSPREVAKLLTQKNAKGIVQSLSCLIGSFKVQKLREASLVAIEDLV